MNTFSTIVKFFQDCGWFIYPSALIMAMGIAISIERFLFLSKARNQNRKVWAEVLPMLQKGQFRDVQGVISRSDAAVSKIAPPVRVNVTTAASSTSIPSQPGSRYMPSMGVPRSGLGRWGTATRAASPKSRIPTPMHP